MASRLENMQVWLEGAPDEIALLSLKDLAFDS